METISEKIQNRKMAADALEAHFTGWVNISNQKIEEFKTNLSKNPFHTMEGSRTIFMWSARHKVASRIVKLAANIRDNTDLSDEIVKEVYNVLDDDLMYNVRSCTPNSTCPTTNLSKLYLTEAYVEAIEYVKATLK